MHCQNKFLLRKKHSYLDAGLPSGTEDRDSLKILSIKLLDLLDDLRPDLVFYNTGVLSGGYDRDAVLLAHRHAILNRAADHLSRTVKGAGNAVSSVSY